MEAFNTRPVYPNVQLIIGESPLSPFDGEHFFFAFNQNNSGGSFVRDDNVGECVIIAAKDADHANERAREVGIYFDGCSIQRDCPCCGDRWSDAYGEGDLYPLIYGERPEIHIGTNNFRDRIIVHHADGVRETYQRIKTK